eukprot:PhM_4_TR16366/c0_g1_i3/m.21373
MSSLQHLFVVVIASLLLSVHISAAVITYTLAMDNAERFCGSAGTFPTSGAGAPCSLTSPKWKTITGLGLNPLNKLVYPVDFNGMSVTSAPVPDVSTGNVQLVTGLMGCGSEAACKGTATGAFSSTRFDLPYSMLMEADLMPKVYVGDVANNRLVEMDLTTQTSSIYIGTNAQGSNTDANDFNNKVRTSAVMYNIFGSVAVSAYMLPCHHSRFQPKVSRTTDMVTLLIALPGQGCRTTAHFNGIVYCAAEVAAKITSYTVPGGVDNGLITGGAFAPNDFTMRVSVDVEMKVLWIGADLYLYKYDITTRVATIIAGQGSHTSTGDGPMLSTSYGWLSHPCQTVRYGELLVVGAGSLHRLRVAPPTSGPPTVPNERTRTATDTKTWSVSNTASRLSTETTSYTLTLPLSLSMTPSFTTSGTITNSAPITPTPSVTPSFTTSLSGTITNTPTPSVTPSFTTSLSGTITNTPTPSVT